MKKESRVLIVGAGLAGSDCAYFLASHGVEVVLVEGKSIVPTPAQKIKTFAELVCTNSLKSKDPDSAHGLLKSEMVKLNSLVIKCAQKHAVAAGDALAVDRENFSREVSSTLEEHPLVKIIEREAEDPLALMTEFQCDYVVVATGPLTTEKLEQWIVKNISNDDFYFYDAIAPVVDANTLDFSKLYYKDRYKEVSDEEGENADYLNAPLNKEQYLHLINEMINSEKVSSKDFEEYRFFESCLPVDLMAERGIDTARFSCMKPVGLELASGERPYACVQLRRENLLGDAFNLVGFQTRLTYKEQVRVFRLIPGFEQASFIHLGSVHRNSFLNAKKLLNFDMSSKEFPHLHFAGQITGVEGYTESAASGLYVGGQILGKIRGEQPRPWPKDTAIGALVNYVMTVPKPTPSNINFGLLPSVQLTKEQRTDRGSRKKLKKKLASEQARKSFDTFFAGLDL